MSAQTFQMSARTAYISITEVRRAYISMSCCIQGNMRKNSRARCAPASALLMFCAFYEISIRVATSIKVIYGANGQRLLSANGRRICPGG